MNAAKPGGAGHSGPSTTPLPDTLTKALRGARRVAFFLAVAPLVDDAPGSAPPPPVQTRERT